MSSSAATCRPSVAEASNAARFAGERDARPIAADAVGVFPQIRGRVADGEAVQPDQFVGAQAGRDFGVAVRVGDAQARQVGAGGGGEVGGGRCFVGKKSRFGLALLQQRESKRETRGIGREKMIV